MNPSRFTLYSLLLMALLSLPAFIALAQTGDGYDLSWNTSDGGGTTWSEGGYTLGGTVGQADAGLPQGGGYELSGGFWVGGIVRYGVYLPLVLRGYP